MSLAMMATGLVFRRGHETGGEIRCFLSWFSSLSELVTTQQVASQTKQVQSTMKVEQLHQTQLELVQPMQEPPLVVPSSNDDLIIY